MLDSKPEQTPVNNQRTAGDSDTGLTQPRSRRVRSPGGYVYFVRAGDNVKIGFSMQPLGRLQSLQTSHPQRLEILHTIEGTQKLERGLHKRFRKFRIRGEWFQLSAEIRQFIEWSKCQGRQPPRRLPTPPASLEAPPPPQPKRERPPVIPEVSRLLKLRRQYGANTAIGHHISVLTEALPNHRDATDPDQKRFLATTIARTAARLEILLKEAA